MERGGRDGLKGCGGRGSKRDAAGNGSGVVLPLVWGRCRSRRRAARRPLALAPSFPFRFSPVPCESGSCLLLYI